MLRRAIARTFKIVIIILVVVVILGTVAISGLRNENQSSTSTSSTFIQTTQTSTTLQPSSSETAGTQKISSIATSRTTGSFRNYSSDYTLDLINGSLVAGNSVPTVLNDLMAPALATNLLYDSSNGYVYALNEATNLPIVVDPSSGKLISSINLPSSDAQGLDSDSFGIIALDPTGNFLFDATNLYVPNSTVDYTWNITIISTVTNEVMASIPLGGNSTSTGRPVSMVFDPETDQLFVGMYVQSFNESLGALAGPPSGYVAILNISDDQIETTVVTGAPSPNGVSCPTCLVYDPTNGFVYLSSGYSQSVEGINPETQTVVSNVTVSFPSSLYSSASTAPVQSHSIKHREIFMRSRASAFTPVPASGTKFPSSTRTRAPLPEMSPSPQELL